MLGSLNFIKVGLFALFIAISDVFANSYILENKNQILDKTAGFMNILSSEVFEKTGVSIYVVALDSLNNKPIKEVESYYLQNLKSPYVVLFFVKNDKKIDIITDDKSNEMFDKNSVYWDYIVPLIPKKDEEINIQSVSAFLLNGFVDIADNIASFYDVSLEHGYLKRDFVVQSGVRLVLYIMLFVLLVLFVYVYLRKK